jgi:hypothetical protein
MGLDSAARPFPAPGYPWGAPQCPYLVSARFTFMYTAGVEGSSSLPCGTSRAPSSKPFAQNSAKMACEDVTISYGMRAYSIASVPSLSY